MNAPESKLLSPKEDFLAAHLKDGEVYAGLLLGKKGEPDMHLVLLPGEGESLTWAQAKDFAKKAGGELPTRREQSLLFANAKEHFQSAWYWSGEEYASGSGSAWGQYFCDGSQLGWGKDYKLRARAVRRLVIE